MAVQALPALTAIKEGFSEGARAILMERWGEQIVRGTRLNEVIRGTLEITRSRWREEMRSRGVDVEAQTSFGTLPMVAGDPAELREAMWSLLKGTKYPTSIAALYENL